MVPGRGQQGGGHARGHPYPALLPHRPAVRAARRLPQGRGAADGDMVSGRVVVRALIEGSKRFHNHGEGSFYGLLLVESAY